MQSRKSIGRIMEFLNLSLGQFLAHLRRHCSLFRRSLSARSQPPQTDCFHAALLGRRRAQRLPSRAAAKSSSPFRLLLQLLGMALLLLAIAEFQFGGRRNARRDHVLVLDTSAWMGAALPPRPIEPMQL